MDESSKTQLVTSFNPVENSVSIPHIHTNHGVHDKLRSGICFAKDSLSAAHPLEMSEKRYLNNKQDFEFKIAEKSLGLYAPFVYFRERQLAAQVKRLGGLESSFLHLDVLLNTDQTIGFSDFLQDYRYRHRVKGSLETRGF